jgi:hypothetical protein
LRTVRAMPISRSSITLRQFGQRMFDSNMG